MRRLIPLLGAVLALALSSTAAADTFRVQRPHGSGGGGAIAFTPDSTVVPFRGAQSGPMSFEALRGIWQAAGNAYGIPWEVLAAINKVETDFGRNLGPSSAGAIGWMQFMPSTWARWGVDANGDGVADPDNPTDAIFSAAHYLAGCGGQLDIAAAVYCYNHATWYVDEVLGLATQYSQNGGLGLFAVDQVQTRLDNARHEVATSRTQLKAVRAQARQLARREQRFLHVANTAPLLSDQLAARKQSVLIGVRRFAADSRAAQLRRALDTATTQLRTAQDQANAAFASSGTQLLSTPVFTVGGADASGSGNSVVSIALQFLGVPYLWGGGTPMGFDCSGLVKYVYAQLGVSLPHNTVAQWNDPRAASVPRNELQPGDLLFFDGLDHVGIYLGGGEFVDAPHTGAFVRVDSLTGWYAANFDGAKRIVGASSESAPQVFSTTALTAPGNTTFTSNVVYFTITH
jgi:cell wall-associated NlpC family hydrolase